MIHFSKILLGITILLLLLWQLPWCYRFFTSKSQKTPFTVYSCVIGDFALTEAGEGKGVKRTDLAGNLYTEAEFDSILPMFYYRQLMSDDRLPDSINGVAITPRLIQTESFNFRHSPEDINAPVIGLYPLLESLSGRVDLKMPDDVFRITDKGLEFIDIETNSVKDDKSHQFTEAMIKKGFVFPAKEINGNPTTRKEYDEGYMLLDAENKLFHLKQVKGKPYLRPIDVPLEITLKHLFITEFKNKKTLAFMTDTENCFYVLNNKTYDIVKVGIPSFNPEANGMTILGNMFDWTIRVATEEGDNFYAIRADDYSLIKSTGYKSDYTELPVQLYFTSGADKFVKPRM